MPDLNIVFVVFAIRQLKAIARAIVPGLPAVSGVFPCRAWLQITNDHSTIIGDTVAVITAITSECNAGFDRRIDVRVGVRICIGIGIGIRISISVSVSVSVCVCVSISIIMSAAATASDGTDYPCRTEKT